MMGRMLPQQVSLVATRLAASDELWSGLLADLGSESSVAEHNHLPDSVEMYVRSVAEADDAAARTEMWRVRRVLNSLSPSSPSRERVEAAAVGLFMLAATRWIAAEPVENNRFVRVHDPEAVKAPREIELYCAVICSALVGAQLLLHPSEVAAVPKHAQSHLLVVDDGTDATSYRFERELFAAVFRGDPEAATVCNEDTPLPAPLAAKLAEHIESLHEVKRTQLTIVLTPLGDAVLSAIAASKLANTIRSPLFCISNESCRRIAGVTKDDLVAAVNAFWGDLHVYPRTVGGSNFNADSSPTSLTPTHQPNTMPTSDPKSSSQTGPMTIYNGPVFQGVQGSVQAGAIGGGAGSTTIAYGTQIAADWAPVAALLQSLLQAIDLAPTSQHASLSHKDYKLLEEAARMPPKDPEAKGRVMKVLEGMAAAGGAIEGTTTIVNLAVQAFDAVKAWPLLG